MTCKDKEFAPIVTESQLQRSILIATCAALMAVTASVSGLNIAQRDLSMDLNASQEGIIWIINAYTLALAASLLPIGAIGDRWGRRPVFVAGLVLFIGANLTSSLSGHVAVMIGARVVAGIAGAMIMPITLSIITTSFPEDRRARAIGIWTAVAGGGGLIGMFTAAIMVDFVSWRWLFAPPIAFAATSLVIALSSVPDSRNKASGSFDFTGAVLSMVAVISLVLAVHEGASGGWTEPGFLFAVSTGVASGLAFLKWEVHRREPLLDVSVFKQKNLSAGTIALVGSFGLLGGTFVVLFLYLQAVLGWSSLKSMGGMMPIALTMMICSGFASKLMGRIGGGPTIVVGTGIAAVGFVVGAILIPVSQTYFSMLPGVALIAGGFGLTMPPGTEAITQSLPSSKQGIASALNSATREFGTALGVALLGAIFSANYDASVRHRLDGAPSETVNAVASGIGSLQNLEDVVDNYDALVSTARSAFTEAWSRGMWIGAAVTAALFGFLLTNCIPRQIKVLD